MKDLYIGTQADPKDRLHILITNAESRRIPRGIKDIGKIVRVLDSKTKVYFNIRVAHCGLGCWCAVELV